MTTPRMRAGHGDRQAAVDRLTEHFTQGRLNPEEFDERIGKAYAATYLDEIPELFDDLPDDRAARRQSASPWPGPDRAHGRWPSPPPDRSMQRPQPPLVAVVAVVSVLAMFFAIGALSHGFFPFPLLWILLLAFFVTRGRRRRRWAEHGGHPHHWGPPR